MNNISIKNFKCFKTKTDISLSDITVNAGVNSVGKSTLIQALLIMRQTYDEILKYSGTGNTRFNISLNGPYELQVGTYTQISSSGSDNITLGIGKTSLTYTIGPDEFSLTYDSGETPPRLPKNPLFEDSFYYINAERVGPRNYQTIKPAGQNQLCGCHGEYTFEALEKYDTNTVPEEKRAETDGSVKTLLHQTQLWMDYIAPGIEFSTNRDAYSRTATLKMRQTTLDTDFISPHNFGFGISYLLPIIVTGLFAEKGSVMIIENPEAHLHPGGQSKIGYFLAKMADAGVKIIIETHSEHVINGIRLYALKNRMSAERICLNYFASDADGPKVTKIPLSERMDILKWPEGFFDQEEKDLYELRQLRRSYAD